MVLAAGGSSRMGSSKQLLRLDGQSLLQRAATAALNSGCRPSIVVLGHDVERMRLELAHLAITIIENPDWQLGMGSSIRAGMAAVQSPDIAGVVITLCDQPNITATAIARLVETFQRTGQTVAARYAGTVGVPAVFGRERFQALRSLDPASGAKRLLIGPEVIPVDLPAAAVDLDTPEDYRRFVDTR